MDDTLAEAGFTPPDPASASHPAAQEDDAMSCDQDRTPTNGWDAVQAWITLTYPSLEDLPGYLEMTEVVARTRDAAGDDGLAWLEAYVLGRATSWEVTAVIPADVITALDEAIAKATAAPPPPPLPY